MEIFKHADNKKKVAKVWRKLGKQEEYLLFPDDIIKVGQLQLLVQRFNVGIVSDIGTRAIMEDFYQIIHDLKISESIHCSYYGVYDGHGGEYCAKYVQSKLPYVLKKLIEKEIQQSKNVCLTMAQALKQAFAEVDISFHTEFKDLSWFSGSTVVIVVILGSTIFCANIGDSRAILSKEGLAYNLSLDHKAAFPKEEERIKAAGGEVKCGRTMGKVAISRAMGDFQYKNKPIIISEPEVRVWEIDPNKDEFIVMGSDGLFDKFTSQEAVTFARKKLLEMEYMEQDLNKVAKDLSHESLYVRNVRDNVTAMVIGLNRGIEKE